MTGKQDLIFFTLFIKAVQHVTVILYVSFALFPIATHLKVPHYSLHLPDSLVTHALKMGGVQIPGCLKRPHPVSCTIFMLLATVKMNVLLGCLRTFFTSGGFLCTRESIQNAFRI